MVDYADIGKRIRACRLAKGMTQEQLANEVGVVVTHIKFKLSLRMNLLVH